MNAHKLYTPLRWLSHAVLALIAMALVYAAYISITYYPGIAV